MPTLLALHGQTLNGALMRQQLAPLVGVELICADGPIVCAPDLVDRIYGLWDAPRQPPPHLAWWDASDDGRTYRGWDATLALLTPFVERGLGILGFSQGAIVATALAAMFPTIPYVILIAGRAPRADAITPYLTAPIRTPSLHVWGDDDHLARDTACELVERFDPSTRQVVTWPGSHTIPTRGPAWDAIQMWAARS